MLNIFWNSSLFWTVIIVIGVSLVAFGNVRYNITKGKEDKVELAKQSTVFLKSEIKENIESLNIYLKEIETENKKEVEDKKKEIWLPVLFKTTSWEIVRTSNLILGMDSEKTLKLMYLYDLIETANEINLRIVEGKIGPPASHTQVQESIPGLESTLEGVLKKLDLKFKELAL